MHLVVEGISRVAERSLDDEMWVEVWCSTLQSATVRDVVGSWLADVSEVRTKKVVGNDARLRQ